MDFLSGRAKMLLMASTLIARLRDTGKAVGKSAAGTVYTLRPAKDMVFTQLIEVYRGDKLMDTRTFTDVMLWANRIGFEVQ